MPVTELSPHALIARYTPLSRRLVRPFCRRFPEWSEEFRGAAALALVEAAKRFDPRKGRFGPYATRRIHGALVDERYKFLNSVSTYEHLDMLSDEMDDGNDVDPEEFEAAIAALPRVLKPLLRLLFLEHVHLDDAAAELRVPHAIARRRLAEAAERLGHRAPRQRFDRTA